MSLIVFDLEWNIGYQPRLFDYHGAEQTLRGEIIQIGAVKVDETGRVLDTFSLNLKPRLFRKLQHHIAKVTGMTQADLDGGVPIREGLQRFVRWCGPDAAFAEWGMDDVPVLKQNLFLNNLDERWPTRWYDLQQIFLAQRGRAEGEGMTLESVITRLGIPTDRPFHDALSDALYTVDVCQRLDLARGIAEYPTEEQQLRRPPARRGATAGTWSASSATWRRRSGGRTPPCTTCAARTAAACWPRRSTPATRTRASCGCAAATTAITGWFTAAAASSGLPASKWPGRDGLHWAFARCYEAPTPESLAKWEKQKRLMVERLKHRTEKAEG